MTIASPTSRVTYTGDGATTAFPVPFYFAANADLVVYSQDTAGVQTLQVLGTHYTLTGATVSAGGTCTFTTAPVTGYLISIYRDPPATQTTSYNNNDPFPAKSHELALDKLTTLAQRTRDIANRSIHQSEGEAAMTTTLAPIATRKNKLAGYGNAGELIYALGPTFVAGSYTASAFIDSRATAMVTTFPVSVNAIITSGYATSGDGGRARYKRVVSLAAGMLGFQSADGAWWQIAETTLTPEMAGAIGDGAVDDSVAIRNAAASTPLGGALVFSRIYGVTQDGVAAYCLGFITQPISLIGIGSFAGFKPLASVGATINTIYYKPSPSYDYAGTKIENLILGDYSNGTRRGLHGLMIDTQVTGANLFRKVTIGKNRIFQGTGATGRAIFHVNNVTNNPNGAMFATTIEDNLAGGGILLSGSGDTISVNRNLIANNNIGVEVVLAPGATGPYINDNNITSLGGAVKIDAAASFAIRGGIFEMLQGSTPSNGATIDINGGTSTVAAGIITGVALNSLASPATVTKHIRIRNSVGIKIDNNAMPSLTADSIASIDIASSNSCIVGNNLVGTTTSVVDDGASVTIGVVFQVGAAGRPAFTNSWVNFGSGGVTASFYKETTGRVVIEGLIKTGTVGTSVFTLPLGYRPALNHLVTVYSSGVPATVLTINVDGTVVPTAGNTQVSINCSFMSVDQGSVVSNL